MDTLTAYLLLMAASHAGGVIVSARGRDVMAAAINAVLLAVNLILLLERL
jgi:hypothetical protein